MTTQIEDELGSWLSAALDDDNACEEFKSAVRRWFDEKERIELQQKKIHPEPCAGSCEANAFNIEIRRLKSAMKAMLNGDKQKLNEYTKAINEIDDYFEYSMESKKDQKEVHKILGNLTDRLKINS